MTKGKGGGTLVFHLSIVREGRKKRIREILER